jgi:hypothetical protein
MINFRVAAIAGLLVLPASAMASTSHGESEKPAEAPLAQVLSLLRDSQRRIDAIQVSYRTSYDATESAHPGAYLHRMVALKSPCMVFHLNAHGHDELSWEDDPLLWRCWMTEDQWFEERTNSAMFSAGPLSPNDPLIGSLPNEWIFWATGLWPLRDRPAPLLHGRVHYMLGDYVDEAPTIQLRPNQELIRGIWCHVLVRPGIDTMWVDVKRNASVVAREIYEDHLEQPMRRFELLDHVEVDPHVWLPMTIWDRRFDSDKSGKNVQPSGETVVFQIREWRLNSDVDDRLFHFSPSPGALWTNPPSGKPEQVDHFAEEHFTRVVRIARKATAENSSGTIWPGQVAAFVAAFLTSTGLTVGVARGCGARLLIGRRDDGRRPCRHLPDPPSASDAMATTYTHCKEHERLEIESSG